MQDGSTKNSKMTAKFKKPVRALGEKFKTDPNKIPCSASERMCYNMFMGGSLLPEKFWEIPKKKNYHEK